MSLAKAIQNDDCDCELGVYSAAKVFDLEFIPICEEEYDLLIKTEYLELEFIKNILEVIKDNKFLKNVKNLGGYNTNNAGEIISI